MDAAPDPPAELVQLRQAEALGALDQHRRRVRHVDPNLDHRRRHQDVELVVAEGHHHLVLLARQHLAVDQRHAQVGEDLALQPGVGLLGRG